MSVLQATEIRKSFLIPHRLDIIINISLTIEAGESIAICGKSGEGKTTLLHILGTLAQLDSGCLKINGIDAHAGNAHFLRRKHIGFIFQTFNLLEDFTAIENVLMPVRIGRGAINSQSTAYEQAISLLDEVGLIHRMDTPAKILSGGERQRVAIARALCNNPSLVLADEPFGNLDRNRARQMADLLLHCVKTKQKSLIVVTHDPELAGLCNRRYLLKEGLLIPSHSIRPVA